MGLELSSHYNTVYIRQYSLTIGQQKPNIWDFWTTYPSSEPSQPRWQGLVYLPGSGWPPGDQEFRVCQPGQCEEAQEPGPSPSTGLCCPTWLQHLEIHKSAERMKCHVGGSFHKWGRTREHWRVNVNEVRRLGREGRRPGRHFDGLEDAQGKYSLLSSVLTQDRSMWIAASTPILSQVKSEHIYLKKQKNKKTPLLGHMCLLEFCPWPLRNLFFLAIPFIKKCLSCFLKLSVSNSHWRKKKSINQFWAIKYANKKYVVSSSTWTSHLSGGKDKDITCRPFLSFRPWVTRGKPSQQTVSDQLK